MTQQQLNRADEAIKLLNDARNVLDDAMYHMGPVDVNDPDYKRTRAFYDAICKALDLV